MEKFIRCFLLLSGFAGFPLFADTEEPARSPPFFGWTLLWAGSWEGKSPAAPGNLINRGDLRLSLPWYSLALRTQLVDKRPGDFSSLPWKSPEAGNTAFSGGLYHQTTGSRVLYGILDEWGLPSRLRNPWVRAVPFPEYHQPSAADLKNESSSTGTAEGYLYLGSPQWGPLRLSGFARIGEEHNPGLGGGLELRPVKKTDLRLEFFFTEKTLPPRKTSTWFSADPPLPERDFRLYGLGLLADFPFFVLSGDGAVSETFAFGRDFYANLGIRAGNKPWRLSLAADGAGKRYIGRDGSAPGPGFRSAGKLEWYGKRGSLFRLGTSLRSREWGEAFYRSSTSLYYRFPGRPGGGKKTGSLLNDFPLSLRRLSLSAERNAADLRKVTDSLDTSLGLALYPAALFPGAAGRIAGLQAPFFFSLSFSVDGSFSQGETAMGELPPPYPVPAGSYRFESAKTSGEISWSPGSLQFRTRLGYGVKKGKEGIWETSASAALRLRPGRLGVKISSPDFPEKWEYTVSWRLEKK
ncbi:MAG: hypothetical protein LBP23_09385 [Treponema sp.]|nr:hypothetical protein [Treponema sp.]